MAFGVLERVHGYAPGLGQAFEQMRQMIARSFFIIPWLMYTQEEGKRERGG